MFISIYSSSLDKLINLISWITDYQNISKEAIFCSYFKDFNALDKHIESNDNDMFIFVDDGLKELYDYINTLDNKNIVLIGKDIPTTLNKNIKLLSTEEEFKRYLDLFFKDFSVLKDIFVLKSTDGYRRIPYNQIKYIELRQKRAYFSLKDEKTIMSTSLRVSLGEYLKDLLKDKRFIRCHSAFVVNKDYVSKLDKNSFILDDGTLIPISNKRLNEVISLFSLV